MHEYYVYILTNIGNNVLYIGVTNDLRRRLYEHKTKLVAGFTEKYHLNKLVYFEHIESIETAIAREKQLKGGSRLDKIKLVESTNPNWTDLGREIASS